ncbi:MAG: hypothetical protein E7051_08085 [Lentisphaerae bacterium]|nr:hypothetical protein [Lentisphaerota bacterium]
MIYKMCLDGRDWEADYFLSEREYYQWKGRHRTLFNMMRNCAQSAGFVRGDECPGTMTGTVPGYDRTFLLENGECEDPYFARNLERTKYAEDYSWAFRKRFTVPAEWKGKSIELEFKGLDYSCWIFINSQWLGPHKGMFIRKSYDVTQYINFGGENIVAVVFDPAPKGSPNHFDDEPTDFSRLHRTQISFGWDWSRGFVPTGIYDSVNIFAYDQAFITGKQIIFDGENAVLKVEIESRSNCTMPFFCKLSPDNFKGKSTSFETELDLKHGANKFVFDLPLPDDLKLWYPLGYGEQSLYTLDMVIDGAADTLRTGFKTVEMFRNPGSPRDAADLTYVINGRKVFARGANYVPADLLLSWTKEADYEHLVASAAAVGINYFRIWGGGVLEKDAFFDACNRHGVMVHQEFFHACSKAPKDEEFIAFKKMEAVEVIRRIWNHPCLVLVCGGNEMQYYGEMPNNIITGNYRETAKQLIPHIPFRTSSPDLSRPGERHHGPWHYLEHSFWKSHCRNFASEVGCNAMPEFESLKRFIPEREIALMRGPALEYHFCHLENEYYNLKKPLQVFKYDGMKEFCDASMFAQADAVQCIYEHYRRLWPEASGCVFWQYNEPWPTCSFSLIDYYGVPKNAMYTMKRAAAKTLISLEDDSWCCKDNSLQGKLYITADEAIKADIEVRAYDCASGAEAFCYKFSGEYAEGTTLLADINEPLISGITAVFFCLNGEVVNERLYGVPDFKNAFKLPQTTLEVKQQGNAITVTNTGSSVAVNVKASFKGLPDKSVIFLDNYISIAPGASRVITFTGDSQGVAAEVSAWNCKIQ